MVFGEEQELPLLFSSTCVEDISIPTVVHVLYHDTIEHSFIPSDEVIEAFDSLQVDMDEANIGINLVDVT